MCLGLTTFGGLEVWAAPLVGGRIGVVLFNRSPQVDEITARWADIGAEAAQKYAVRDVWAAADRGSFSAKYTCQVPAHATTLLVLTPA